MNLAEQNCFNRIFSHLLGKYSGVGLLDYMVILFLVFGGNSASLSLVTVLITAPTSSAQGLPLFSASPLTPVVFHLFYSSHPDRCELISHCGFISITIIDVEQFFIDLLAVCMSYFEKCLLIFYWILSFYRIFFLLLLLLLLLQVPKRALFFLFFFFLFF